MKRALLLLTLIACGGADDKGRSQAEHDEFCSENLHNCSADVPRSCGADQQCQVEKQKKCDDTYSTCLETR